jgi:hypothetical protein
MTETDQTTKFNSGPHKASVLDSGVRDVRNAPSSIDGGSNAHRPASGAANANMQSTGHPSSSLSRDIPARRGSGASYESFDVFGTRNRVPSPLFARLDGSSGRSGGTVPDPGADPLAVASGQSLGVASPLLSDAPLMFANRPEFQPVLNELPGDGDVRFSCFEYKFGPSLRKSDEKVVSEMFDLIGGLAGQRDSLRALL